ncbi:MAG: hypothetical protein IPK67_15550 [Planctomycetes bacterium]|nr:hypothetical protein [Planctomycetota bacterium]
MTLEGSRHDWVEDLPLGWIEESVAPGSGPLRLHLGSGAVADRVSIQVEADAQGMVRAPAPLGTIELQSQRIIEARALWTTLKRIEVLRR